MCFVWALMSSLPSSILCAIYFVCVSSYRREQLIIRDSELNAEIYHISADYFLKSVHLGSGIVHYSKLITLNQRIN